MMISSLVFLVVLQNVLPRHLTTSGEARVMLPLGSLAAPTLNNMKLKNIASPWAWSQFLWTPLTNRMSSTD